MEFVWKEEDERYFQVASDFFLYRLKFPELFETDIQDLDAKVHHYTDLNGLIGIIESQCLFASDIRFVNDKAELQYGLDLIKDIANEMTNETNESVFSFLITNLPNFFPKNRYITCFSTHGDLLQQWQSYARNGMGVSIGLEFRNISYRQPKLIPNVTARKIIYEQRRQVEMIRQQISRTLDFFSQKQFSDWSDSVRDAIIAQFIVDSLTDAISSFKHPCFAHENEYRFFYLPSGNEKYNIKFRTNSKLIIPYVRLETMYRYYSNEMAKPDNELGAMPTILEPDRLLPIKEIVIGPGLDYESVKEGVDILLSENGYKNVKIIKSELPYRV